MSENGPKEQQLKIDPALTGKGSVKPDKESGVGGRASDGLPPPPNLDYYPIPNGPKFTDDILQPGWPIDDDVQGGKASDIPPETKK